MKNSIFKLSGFKSRMTTLGLGHLGAILVLSQITPIQVVFAEEPEQAESPRLTNKQTRAELEKALSDIPQTAGEMSSKIKALNERKQVLEQNEIEYYLSRSKNSVDNDDRTRFLVISLRLLSTAQPETVKKFSDKITQATIDPDPQVFTLAREIQSKSLSLDKNAEIISTNEIVDRLTSLKTAYQSCPTPTDITKRKMELEADINKVKPVLLARLKKEYKLEKLPVKLTRSSSAYEKAVYPVYPLYPQGQYGSWTYQNYNGIPGGFRWGGMGRDYYASSLGGFGGVHLTRDDGTLIISYGSWIQNNNYGSWSYQNYGGIPGGFGGAYATSLGSASYPTVNPGYINPRPSEQEEFNQFLEKLKEKDKAEVDHLLSKINEREKLQDCLSQSTALASSALISIKSANTEQLQSDENEFRKLAEQKESKKATDTR